MQGTPYATLERLNFLHLSNIWLEFPTSLPTSLPVVFANAMVEPVLLPNDVVPKSVANYVKLYSAQINGISIRYADTDGGSQQKLPLVLFLHGWPESWFSYRYQLKECKNNGFRGVAPDMRGYGSTTAPPRAEQYNVYALAADAVGLVHRLGYTKCMLVGHDHGAILSWKLKLMFPDVFVVLCALSVPYNGRPKLPGLEVMRKSFGNEKDKEHAKFFYQLHHQLYPEAAVEYDANAEEALFRIYSMNADAERNGILHGPEITTDKMYVEGEPRGWWWRMPKPASLPHWLDENDFQYYVSEFKRSGFQGGLFWYVSTNRRDLDWTLTKHLQDKKVPGPVLFVAGCEDVVLRWSGGITKVRAMLNDQCLSPPQYLFVENCGHWIQQEAFEEVNNCMFAFLKKHRKKVLGHYSKL